MTFILITIKILSKNIFSSKAVNEYKILLWTKYYSNDWPKTWSLDSNCRYNNCLFTQNRNDFFSSDAVLFHWRDIDTDDLPKYTKQSNQKWILFNMEAPVYTYMKYPNMISEINLFKSIDWVMSYTTDSDIYIPYGRLERCRREWTPKHKFENKSESIAWIVSHCETSSKRELLVEKLKKSFDVDIYGDCGHLKCANQESCYQTIERKYKFYLSFENSVRIII